jgi:hypothetical protein
MLRLILIVVIPGFWQQAASAQVTQPADDAAKIYLQAAKLLSANDKANIMSPSSSNLNYTAFPPYPAEWHRMEKKDFLANSEARALAHQARSIEHATWPKWNPPHPTVEYLYDCRNISNELADAAVYQHIQGNDAAAVESLQDDWHLADLLENESDKLLVRLLVSEGIQAEIYTRLEIITSNIVLTNDPANTKALQASVARELIGRLLTHQDVKTQVNDVLRDESRIFHTSGNPNPITKRSIDRVIETINRVNSERDMAAMSLACHLYRFDTGKWPKSLHDLGEYLPTVPIDPWGDGKQTLGYVLVKGGLPDGSDRPLIYSRGGMKDGLFFRTDEPAYAYYNGDGSHRPGNKQKQGGQFRDVASWAPEAGTNPAPTTRPLE